MRAFGAVLRDSVISLLVTGFIAGLFFAGGEIYFRMTRPFLLSDQPTRFVRDLGFLYAPDTEQRYTNQLDFWTVQKSNPDGFLDLPVPPFDTVKDKCRIAFVGDSFVDAREVVIAQKMQTRLMELAPKDLPNVPISAAAFGFAATGQLNQLPFYDFYAAKYRPNVIVLVFVMNDFANNTALLEAIRSGFDPEHPPRPFARRAADGTIAMLPVDNDGWRAHLFPSAPGDGLVQRANAFLRTHSYFYAWIYTKLQMVLPKFTTWLYGFNQIAANTARRDALAARPGNAALLAGFSGNLPDNDNPVDATTAVDMPFTWEKMPPIFEEGLAFTGFALDQFVARARRDGAKLVIVSTENMRYDDQPADRRYKRLEALAAARNIPIIDMYDYNVSRGRSPFASAFPADMHWNPDGHLWAAQALLGFLKAHPDYCPASSASAASPSR
ncbi:SGNH/GDSL hydrolase family protein [Aquabacter spiritensis]|uniref:GDSL-like lipase/acylhydrolase family protein n=1 Tax=Aquabacter spiritensis TaxID=933073 RepID=A0A4R3M0E7_9HYPH|nr:SGNH/GDSL hydrolase family protein [Aquabacter spiritensis]TCT06534.1 hypothetical protein EDC64_10211 [Aquabacter spiritensis]